MSIAPQVPTQKQKDVADAPSATRVIVEAGPGTGKTFTLIRRLLYLYKVERLIPATEILVLSFSVSAVREVRKRITEAQSSGELPDDELDFAQIRTFDSFASRLLWEAEGEKFLAGKDYDERIQDAIRAVRTSESIQKRLSGLRHILIDEMQDLVSLRADFAFEILKAAKGGLTLFADSAQGIYDFQIDETKSLTRSADLIQEIRRIYPDIKESVCFDKNWRVGGNSELLGIASRGRALILQSVGDAWAYLYEKYRSLESKGASGKPNLAPGLVGPHTCVVCRTNADALKLAGALHREGVPFQLARAKSDAAIAKWVGKLFFACEGNKIAEPDFEELAKRRLDLEPTRSGELWKDLCVAVGAKRRTAIDYISLRAAIDAGAVLFSDDYDESVHSGIVLSTIHRAKGKEYDNVIVVFDDNGTPDEDEIDEATRVLFVGLTRAKKQLFRVERGFNLIRKTEDRKRCVRLKPKGAGTFFFTGMEIGLAGDLDASSFASEQIAGDLTELQELQRCIADEIQPGDSAHVEWDRFENGCPIYQLFVKDRKVGETTTAFGWDLWNMLKYARNGWKPKQFPRRLSDFWVREIITVVGDLSREDVPRPFKNSGLWNGVRVEGIASTSGTKWVGR